jgi:hypothetical protein
MDMEAKELVLTLLAVGRELTLNEFVSLLAVSNVGPNDPAPAIPAEHSARLTALGYVADLEGKLRMTSPGRNRIAVSQ